MNTIENRTFDEIKVGDTASLVRTLTSEDFEVFGMWGGGLISTLLGTKLPGPGTIYVEQSLRFWRPVSVGEAITASVTATFKDPATHRVILECRCVNQAGEVVIDGIAEVTASASPSPRVR